MFRHPNRAIAALAVCATGVIWVLSLMPITQPVPGGDKLHHLLGYAALMVVWRAAMPKASFQSQVVLAIVLAVMGAAIECAQALTPHRLFEWTDMAANTLGVLLGWCSFNGAIALWGRRAAFAPRGN